MMTCTSHTESSTPHRAPRRVGVVSQNPGDHLPDPAIDAADVVFMASMAHGYSQVRSVSPDLVVLCLSADDEAGYRVLSMLKLDSQTSGIPVVTCTAPAYDASGNPTEAEFRWMDTSSMN